MFCVCLIQAEKTNQAGSIGVITEYESNTQV